MNESYINMMGFTHDYDSNDGCTGASVTNIVSPGINNLQDFGFNDRASTYRCN